MSLSGRLVTASELSAEQRDDMFALMDRYFCNVQRPIFEADLDDKHWVIQLHDSTTGQLCGFSTQRLLRVEVEDYPSPPAPLPQAERGAMGRHIQALFSGDTIIDRQYWGDQALIHVWGQLALSLIDNNPDTELYWFLISQGYKTYRFLPIFFREFFPRHDVAAPPWVKPVIDALARTRYAEDFDADAGVIRATARQYRLRAGVADITEERLTDPHVRFFQTRNPGHSLGDELCCLARLSRANFTRAAYRVIGAAPVALEVS